MGGIRTCSSSWPSFTPSPFSILLLAAANFFFISSIYNMRVMSHLITWLHSCFVVCVVCFEILISSTDLSGCPLARSTLNRCPLVFLSPTPPHALVLVVHSIHIDGIIILPLLIVALLSQSIQVSLSHYDAYRQLRALAGRNEFTVLSG